MLKPLGASLRSCSMFLVLVPMTPFLPRGAVAQDACLADGDCDDGNLCTDDLCSTTTNRACLWLDGDGDTAWISDRPSLNPASGITLSAWIRLDGVGTRQAILDKAFTSETEPYYQYHLEVRATGQLYFALAVNGTRKIIDTTMFAVGIGVWHHVAGTWDGATMRLYLDGVPYPSSTSAPGVLSSYATGVFLGNNYGGMFDLGGRLDEVAIYGRGLSAEEVRFLARHGSLGDPELRARWPLDDGEGNVAHDTSGNDNHLGVSGPDWDTSELVDFGIEGFCLHSPADVMPCDDALSCTSDDMCDDGSCVGIPASCDDGVACTVDTCAEPFGCAHAPSDAACDDGTPCTQDSCEPAAGGCVQRWPTCDDGNPCTTDTVHPQACCTFVVDDSNACHDADFCNGVEYCRAGECRPGTAPGEVTHLRLSWYDTYALLTWDSNPANELYDLAVGALAALHADGGVAAAACLVDDLSHASYLDLRPAPPPGEGEYYLGRTIPDGCLPSWGYASDGTERVPTNACP
ncbi:MAG TPA: LamG domain-containing protein [Candidatus Polarisedimenticolaceae bacterium]